MTRDEQIDDIAFLQLAARWVLPIIVAFAVIVAGLTASAERITYSYESSLATSTQTHAAHAESVELALRAYQTYFTVEFVRVARGGQWKIGVYSPPPGIGSNWVWAWPTLGTIAIGPDARMIGPGTPFHETLHLLGSQHSDGPPGTRLHDSGGADAWLTEYDVGWITANTSWELRPGWNPVRIAADRLKEPEPTTLINDHYTLPSGVWSLIDPLANDSGTLANLRFQPRRTWDNRPHFPRRILADGRVWVRPYGRAGRSTWAEYWVDGVPWANRARVTITLEVD